MSRRQRADLDWWQPVLRRLREASVVCVDTETSGLDWRHNHIVGWVFTFSPDPRDSFYLPVRHAPGGNILDFPGPQTARGWDGSPHPIEKEIIDCLDQPGKLVFGHHLAFDLKAMWRLGLQNHDARFECTQVNAALLDEHHYSFSLEFCCEEAQVQAKKSREIRDYIRSLFPDAKEGDEMGHYWRLHGHDPVGNDYAKGDGTSTWQLRDWQWPHLDEQGLDRVHDVECRLIPVLVRMTCRGIRVDEERVREIIEQIDSGELERRLGFPPGFNAKAPTQVKEWLTRHGITNWPTTAKGNAQLNEAWLSTTDPGSKIVSLRQQRTLKDSFLKPMLAGHIWNGRVHPNYNQTKSDDYGTVTGRLSCSDPNLQQASKRNEAIGRLHRSCFLADEGMIWGSVDYAQCEPVLLAVYSGAKVLREGFLANPPRDAHSSVTKAVNAEWNRMSQEDFDRLIVGTPEFKAARDIGKRVNQTLLTGGGQGVLTEKYGIPPAEVRRIWADYFRALPEIKRLQKNSGYVMRARGFVVSLLGRRARLKGWPRDKSKSYTSVNRLLQCGNADIIKLKMVEVDEYLKSEGRPIDMINTVHDSLDFQFHEEHRQHYYNCLGIMEDFGPTAKIQLSVPLRVEEGEGPNWAVATFGPEKTDKIDKTPIK